MQTIHTHTDTSIKRVRLSVWIKTVSPDYMLHAVLCLVAQMCPTLYDPTDCNRAGSSICGYSPDEYPGVGFHLPPGDLPNPGIKPGSPALQADSLPAELPGKPFIVIFMIHIYMKFTYFSSIQVWM